VVACNRRGVRNKTNKLLRTSSDATGRDGFMGVLPLLMCWHCDGTDWTVQGTQTTHRGGRESVSERLAMGPDE